MIIFKNDSTRMYSLFKDNYLWPLVIIFIGFSLRLYSFHHSYAINPDGMLYIHQAKTFYSGLYGSLTECYPYLNILPIFISFSYLFTGDWLVAAKAVSLFFGTAAMFPLYLLLRQFVSVPIASCTLLVFAVNPVFVQMSSEVIRGPAGWFFITLGMYLFTLADLKKYDYFLSLSCISFCIASLVRVEAIIFVPGTLLFMLLFSQEKKCKKIIIFLFPLLVIVALALSSMSLLGVDFSQWLYPRSFLDKIVSTVQKYEQVRHGLSEIGSQQSQFWGKFFFPKVSNLLWWLGLGVVLVEIIKTFFEPFFLIFIFGFKGVVQRAKENRRLCYLLLLSGLSFLLLYLHVQGHWVMRKRFVAIFLFPAFFLVGLGLENLSSYLAEKFHIRKLYLILFAGILIFAIALPKNMSENKVKRKVFQEIGETIAAGKEMNQNVKVVGAIEESNLQMINFFSNLTVVEATCVEQLNARVNPQSFSNVSKRINNGENYLIWDEKNWSTQSLESIRSSKVVKYKEIMSWQDPWMGVLILFQINSDY